LTQINADYKNSSLSGKSRYSAAWQTPSVGSGRLRLCVIFSLALQIA